MQFRPEQIYLYVAFASSVIGMWSILSAKKQAFAKGDRVYYIPFSSSIDTPFVFIGDVNTGYAEVVAQENISKYSLVSVGRLQGV